jgi:photosynthetic reaction center cytochrome c subunit
MISNIRRPLALFTVAFCCLFIAGCFERPSPDAAVQRGYRGMAIGKFYNTRTLESQQEENSVPEMLPPADKSGALAGATFKNVQVLKDVDVAEFVRTMQSMAEWVTGDQGGCSYCHDDDDPSLDTKYTKIVARRMLQMVRHINSDWNQHVAQTGVTCYTCHRGHPVPSNIWFTNPGPTTNQGMMAGNKAGQNTAGEAVIGYTALPFDPLSYFLTDNTENLKNLRVQSGTPLATGADRHSVKETEMTYALMVSMSQALGVNCTYCHDTRAFRSWDESSPQRVKAWYGIRMVRDLNSNFLIPLGTTFPPNRHGPLGDGPKLYCATCHKGAFKPLYGFQMAKNYPALAPTLAGSAGQPVQAADSIPAPTP